MKTILIFLLLNLVIATQQLQNATLFQRKNVFLSRKKRYVQWPKGSNFVINLTCSKPLLRYQPLTWNCVYEMDVPFAVSSDIIGNIFKKGAKTKRHVRERRHLYEHLEDFVNVMGMNGKECVNRLLCESGQFIQGTKKSMLKDLIKVLFRSFLEEEELAEYNWKCAGNSFDSCPVSLFEIFINSSPDGASFVRNSLEK